VFDLGSHCKDGRTAPKRGKKESKSRNIWRFKSQTKGDAGGPRFAATREMGGYRKRKGHSSRRKISEYD